MTHFTVCINRRIRKINRPRWFRDGWRCAAVRLSVLVEMNVFHLISSKLYFISRLSSLRSRLAICHCTYGVSASSTGRSRRRIQLVVVHALLRTIHDICLVNTVTYIFRWSRTQKSTESYKHILGTVPIYVIVMIAKIKVTFLSPIFRSLYDCILLIRRGEKEDKRGIEGRYDNTEIASYPSTPPVPIREKETMYNTVSLMQIRFDPWHLAERDKRKENIRKNKIVSP